MEKTDFGTLIGKLSVLEKRYRRLRRLFLALLLVIPGVLLIAGAAENEPKEIEAEQFIIRSSKGEIRGSLGLTKTGNVALRLFNTKEKETLRLEVTNENAIIALSDPAGNERQVMKVTKDDSRFAICDEKGNAQIELKYETNHPTIQLNNSTGKKSIELTCSDSDSSINLYDSNSKRVALQVTDKKTSLDLIGPKKIYQAKMAAGSDGTLLSLTHKSGQGTVISSNETGIYWNQLDKNGKIRNTIGYTKHPFIRLTNEKGEKVLEKP